MKLAGNAFRKVEAAVAICASAVLSSSFVTNAEAFFRGCLIAVLRPLSLKLARASVFSFRDIHANQFR
jgi:hypothetical protein